MQTKNLESRTIILIDKIKNRPALYNPTIPYVTRLEKQQIWDDIAKLSGYKKTEDAKNRWRTLINYFRQHLKNVENKAVRRYIPKTENPNDKYVQLQDWGYYEYMQFMAPYLNVKNVTINKTNTESSSSKATTSSSSTGMVKNCAGTTNATTTTATATATTSASNVSTNDTPMQMKIGRLIVEIEVDGRKQSQVKSVTDICDWLPASKPFAPYYKLSPEDQNLMAFFNAMLLSTAKLPKFHQERIKRKMLNAIRKFRTTKS